MEDKKVTLYKMTYTYTFANQFTVNVKKYDMDENEHYFFNEIEDVFIDKSHIGKLVPYDNSMWLFEENVRQYVDALIKKKEADAHEINRFINACTEYKRTIRRKNMKNVKLYYYQYSFSGVAKYEYDAIELENHYAITSSNLIYKSSIDSLNADHATGRITMYSLNGDEVAFKSKVLGYIKDSFNGPTSPFIP